MGRDGGRPQSDPSEGPSWRGALSRGAALWRARGWRCHRGRRQPQSEAGRGSSRASAGPPEEQRLLGTRTASHTVTSCTASGSGAACRRCSPPIQLCMSPGSRRFNSWHPSLIVPLPCLCFTTSPGCSDQGQPSPPFLAPFTPTHGQSRGLRSHSMPGPLVMHTAVPSPSHSSPP